MRLKNQVAVVTGGGQGIGEAVVMTFAHEGADVAILDYNLEQAERVAEQVRALGRKAMPLFCDISKVGEMDAVMAQITAELGQIDILVNNAGVGEPVKIGEITEAYADRLINTNLKGTLFCAQAAAKVMMEQKTGKIVTICSTQAHVGAPSQAVYSATKGGLLALTRVMAVELAPYGIRVNAVSPSLTETPRIARIAAEKPGYYDNRWKRVPSQRLSKPQDIANAVLFLASDESDNIYGQAIIVDGGTTALLSSYVFPNE